MNSTHFQLRLMATRSVRGLRCALAHASSYPASTRGLRHAKPLLLALSLLFVFASSSSAETLQGQRAVEAGREALTSGPNYPWYDEESDGIRRVDVEPPRDAAAHRGSKWQAKPAQTQSTGDWSWLTELFQVFGQILKWLLWAGIITVFGLLIFLLVRAFMNTGLPSGASSEETEKDDSRTEEDLIESLPFHVKRPRGDLLAEARQHYEEGNYGEAIIYLFSYQLVQMDRHDVIRLTRGKTNRQYLREVWPRTGLRGMFERTMVTFEDVFFGHHPLDREGFESCWLKLDEFHEHVEQAAV